MDESREQKKRKEKKKKVKENGHRQRSTIFKRIEKMRSPF